jgi:hypothetical protein
MSFCPGDLRYLKKLHEHSGWLGPITTSDVDGMIHSHPSIFVQIRLVALDFAPWPGWIEELAGAKPPCLGVPQLTGVGVRRAMYIATAPGNLHPVVSAR